MPDPVSPPSSSPVSPNSASMIAGMTMTGGSPSTPAAGTFSGNVSSIGKLKEVAPEVYKLTLQSWGMQITTSMKHSQDRIHETLRKFRDEQNR